MPKLTSIFILVVAMFFCYGKQPSKAMAVGPIKTTFIAFPWSRQANYTRSEWAASFAELQAIGINKIIIASSVITGYSNLFPKDPITFYPSASMPNQMAREPALDHIFDLADQLDFQVYVGPAEINSYYSLDNGNQRLIELTKVASNEIYARYGQRRSFAGWYLWPESLLNADLGTYTPYKEIVTHLHSKNSSLPVIAAPYYFAPCYPGRFRCESQWWPNLTPDEMALKTKRFLENTGVDILAVQDGMGASEVTLTELDAYLPKMAQATAELGRIFWVDVEVFRYNSTKTDFVPAEFSSLLSQLEKSKNYPIVIWIFDQFMSPTRGNANRALYEAYKSHYFATKPGDLNNDNRVDIFDYQKLISNFGNPYTIFDYQKVISNFGY